MYCQLIYRRCTCGLFINQSWTLLHQILAVDINYNDHGFTIVSIHLTIVNFAY